MGDDALLALFEPLEESEEQEIAEDLASAATHVSLGPGACPPFSELELMHLFEPWDPDTSYGDILGQARGDFENLFEPLDDDAGSPANEEFIKTPEMQLPEPDQHKQQHLPEDAKGPLPDWDDCSSSSSALESEDCSDSETVFLPFKQDGGEKVKLPDIGLIMKQQDELLHIQNQCMLEPKSSGSDSAPLLDSAVFYRSESIMPSKDPVLHSAGGVPSGKVFQVQKHVAHPSYQRARGDHLSVQYAFGAHCDGSEYSD